MSASRAFAALAAVVLSAVLPVRAAVYAPGLAQAKFKTNQSDKTSDILSSSTLTYAAGPVLANTTGSATDLGGASWAWENNTTFGYLGEMRVEAGTTYTFGKSVDDWTYIVVNGTTLIDNGTHDAFISASYTATETGWVPVEIRVGNGQGGAGVSSGALWGVGYNTVGDTSWEHFMAGTDGWAALLDPGDGTLLRAAYSSTDLMTVSSVAIDGADLVVTVSFAGLAAAGTFTAFYGAGDGEAIPGDWDHAVVLATPDAGDTASATYRLAGAGNAAYAAFRLSSETGASIPVFQWTDTYALALAAPAFRLVNTEVGYTNLSFTATCFGLGLGATSAAVDLELATDDAFTTVVRTKRLALTTLGSEQVAFADLSTNTTYYARVVGTNDKNETGASSTVAKTTLNPGAAAGVCSYAGNGFSTLAATAVVTGFGDGSSVATVRLEASQNAGFGVLDAISSEVAATLNASTDLSCEGLAPASSYYLRLRIENEWGLVTYVPLAGTFTTRDIPILASGIGYSFGAGGSTVTITFGVDEVFDGATCTATLTYNGRGAGSKTFSTPGTLTWAGLAAATKAAAATVTVSATVGGKPYSRTWTATVAPGTSSYALSSLAELRDTIFNVGDTATLPALAGASNHYALLDCRTFSLGEDGRTLTALQPGFGGVAAMEWDGSTETFAAAAPLGFGIVIPRPSGSGRVMICTKPNSGSYDWSTAGWTNAVTGAAELPNGVDDVAMVALTGNSTIYLDQSVVLGALYLGFDSENVLPGLATNISNPNNNYNQTIRLSAKNAPTLRFETSGKERALLRFCNFGNRADVLDNNPQIQLGHWDSTAANQLSIVPAGDLDWDCGAVEDYTKTEMRNIYGRVRYGTDRGAEWRVPAGSTLRIINVTGYKNWSDDQGGNAQFWLGVGFPFTGTGDILYEGPGSAYVNNPFRLFEGTVIVRNKQRYSHFSMSSRGGSFWMVNWTAPYSNDSPPANVTLKIEGNAACDGSNLSLAHSYGVVSYGNAHGYGSWGYSTNALPGKTWIMNGGAYFQAGMNNNSVTWREDGTTATETVRVPNGAETLIISNGFSLINLGYNQSSTDRPTNNLEFASLVHAGDGVLVAKTDRMHTSYASETSRAWRTRLVLGGFYDYAIGGTGRADAIHGPEGIRENILEPTAPIVPWIVTTVQSDVALYFPGASPEGELVMAGYPADSILNEVTEPTANVNVRGQTSLTLSADLTVNSLRVPNPNGGSATFNLGAGRTLTITSGGLIVGNGSHTRGGIGNESGYLNGTAGTVYFPRKAYIYTPSQNSADGKHSAIWAAIVSPQGAVFSYPGYLDLGGDQTGIDGHISVNGTDLRLGSANTPCEIDVPVHLYGGNSTLRILHEGSFCRQELHFHDHGTPGSKFVPLDGTTEKVQKLYVDGKSKPRGTYGATGSGAKYIDDNHFSGTGITYVIKDDLSNPLILRIR